MRSASLYRERIVGLRRLEPAVLPLAIEQLVNDVISDCAADRAEAVNELMAAANHDLLQTNQALRRELDALRGLR